jgi:hypothetical protein
MSHSDWEIPTDENISPGDIQPKADLRDADLSEANLGNADLPEANLIGADLPEANLGNADLKGADLRDADLSEADLRDANLSEANLRDADLSEANLRDADLSEADLAGADLSEADLAGADLSEANLGNADLKDVDLRETKFSDVFLSRDTTIAGHRDRVLSEESDDTTAESGVLGLLRLPQHDPDTYDRIARIEHQRRGAYSNNGLTGRARTARVRERKARRREAFAEGDTDGFTDWLWSCLLHGTTRYGVQLNWIVVYMFLLFLLSALAYYLGTGLSFSQSLYYSAVTFTTTWPKSLLPNGIVAAVAAFETFAGTAAIVFLGYVLGTRERV